MTATLQGAIAELITVVSGVTGVQNAPATPTEQITSYPVAMVYAAEGKSSNGMSSRLESEHNIQIALLMPLNDYRQATTTMLPFHEPIIAALFSHRNSRASLHYQSFAGVSYTFGRIDWGSEAFGYIFTIEGVRIKNNI